MDERDYKAMNKEVNHQSYLGDVISSKIKLAISEIKWIEQHNLFGLDFSTKLGTYKDFTFDIRYDYDGNPSENPKCGLCLTVYFCGAKVMSAYGTLDILTKTAENYLERFLRKYGV